MCRWVRLFISAVDLKMQEDSYFSIIIIYSYSKEMDFKQSDSLQGLGRTPDGLCEKQGPGSSKLGDHLVSPL